jgi:hypothetical protein
MAVSVSKSLLGAIIMGTVIWALSRWIQHIHLPPDSGIMQLSICLTAGAAVYGILAYALKLPELQALLQLLAKRKPDR